MFEYLSDEEKEALKNFLIKVKIGNYIFKQALNRAGLSSLLVDTLFEELSRKGYLLKVDDFACNRCHDSCYSEDECERCGSQSVRKLEKFKLVKEIIC